MIACGLFFTNYVIIWTRKNTLNRHTFLKTEKKLLKFYNIKILKEMLISKVTAFYVRII